MRAQYFATLKHVLVEESYPANQSTSIDLVFRAANTTILPHALEFECAVGNKPPVVVSNPDTLLPNATDTITVHGLMFDRGSNFLKISMFENGVPPPMGSTGNGSTWFVVLGIPFPGETIVEDFEEINSWYAS